MLNQNAADKQLSPSLPETAPFGALTKSIALLFAAGLAAEAKELPPGKLPALTNVTRSATLLRSETLEQAVEALRTNFTGKLIFPPAMPEDIRVNAEARLALAFQAVRLLDPSVPADLRSYPIGIKLGDWTGDRAPGATATSIRMATELTTLPGGKVFPTVCFFGPLHGEPDVSRVTVSIAFVAYQVAESTRATEEMAKKRGVAPGGRLSREDYTQIAEESTQRALTRLRGLLTSLNEKWPHDFTALPGAGIASAEPRRAFTPESLREAVTTFESRVKIKR